MAKQTFLGEFEQMVLLTILQLGEEAYAPAMARMLEERAGRRVSRGALYSTLDRLEGKGYLRWSISAPTTERGGNRKRRFVLTPPGLEALRSCHEALLALSKGLEDVLTRSSP